MKVTRGYVVAIALGTVVLLSGQSCTKAPKPTRALGHIHPRIKTAKGTNTLMVQPPLGDPRADLFALINLTRTRFGASALTWDQTIAGAAQDHADAMVSSQRFSWADSSGDSIESRLLTAGYSLSSKGQRGLFRGNNTAPQAYKTWFRNNGPYWFVYRSSLTKVGIGFNAGSVQGVGTGNWVVVAYP